MTKVCVAAGVLSPASATADDGGALSLAVAITGAALPTVTLAAGARPPASIAANSSRMPPGAAWTAESADGPPKSGKLGIPVPAVETAAGLAGKLGKVEVMVTSILGARHCASHGT